MKINKSVLHESADTWTVTDHPDNLSQKLKIKIKLIIISRHLETKTNIITGQVIIRLGLDRNNELLVVVIIGDGDTPIFTIR